MRQGALGAKEYAVTQESIRSLTKSMLRKKLYVVLSKAARLPNRSRSICRATSNT